MTHSRPFQLKAAFTYEASNGDLEDLPKTETILFEFDATDLTMCGYVQKFRQFLSAVGFTDKTIKEYLGEQY